MHVLAINDDDAYLQLSNVLGAVYIYRSANVRNTILLLNGILSVLVCWSLKVGVVVKRVQVLY